MNVPSPGLLATLSPSEGGEGRGEGDSDRFIVPMRVQNWRSKLSMNHLFVLAVVLLLLRDLPTWFRGRGRAALSFGDVFLQPF